MQNTKPLDYAIAACDTLMRKFTPEALPPIGTFHYHQGVFLSGVYKTYKLCGDEKYYAYVKAWVDSIIDARGNITKFNPGQLDDLQPGILLFPLYQRTGDVRYKKALDTIAFFMANFPQTPIGGFWHKAWYRNQMWLDGLYMAGPFCAEYGKTFDAPKFFDSVVTQATFMRERTEDAKTGLWHHAWDYEKCMPWADAVTGRSPEFWGRSIGWVPVALLDDLDFIPADHPGRKALENMIVDLLTALAPYQDAETGLWYQVINKGKEAGNWLESSCTCLFAAAIYKAVRKGLLAVEYLAVADKAYQGIINRIKQDENGILIDNICIGTGVGDYAHYCARPTSTNDLHGAGAFLILCTEAAKSQ